METDSEFSNELIQTNIEGEECFLAFIPGAGSLEEAVRTAKNMLRCRPKNPFLDEIPEAYFPEDAII